MASVGDVDLGASAVHGLCERTEGWAAGLQLAAIALRGASPDRRRAVASGATTGTS